MPAGALAGLVSRPLTTVPSFAVNVTSSMLDNAISVTHASLCARDLPQRARSTTCDLVRRVRPSTTAARRRRSGRATREPTTRRPVVSGSTFPPAAEMRARYSTRSSSTVKYRLLPSADHFGEPAGTIERLGQQTWRPAGCRDDAPAWSGRTRTTSPRRSAGTRWSTRPGSTPAGRRPRPTYVVSCRGVAPALASTTIDVAVVAAIGIGAALADKRDLRAVGRPRRTAVVEVAAGDLLGLLRRDVEEVEMIAQVLQVAGVVALELVAIDDDGRLRLLLPALDLLGVLARIGIAHHEHQARAVGRPLVVVDAALDVGELLGLAAGAIEQPDLRALLLLVLVAARRREREVLAVRAPPRTRLAVLARRELHGPRAVPAHHPDVAVALVLLDVRRPHGVGDPVAVGRDLRVRDALELAQVVQGERALGGLG